MRPVVVIIYLVFLSVVSTAYAAEVHIVGWNTGKDSMTRPAYAVKFLSEAYRESGGKRNQLTVADQLSNHVIDGKVLILSANLSLNEKQKNRIEEFHKRGGGILILGGGETSGLTAFQLVRHYFDVTPLPVSRQTNHTPGLQWKYNHPSFGALPPGYIIKYSTDRQLFHLPPNEITNALAWYVLGSGSTIDSMSQSEEIGAAYYEQSGVGRIAWMGLSPEDLDTAEVNINSANRLFSDLMVWLSGAMIAAVEPWPEQYTSAILTVCEMDHRLTGMDEVKSLLKQNKIPASFTVNSKNLQSNAVQDEFKNNPERKVVLASSPSEQFAGKPLDSQVELIHSHFLSIPASMPKPEFFYLPNSDFDTETFSALKANGISVLMDDSPSGTSYPVVHSIQNPNVPKSSLIEIQKTCTDISEWLFSPPKITVASLPAYLKSDFMRVKRMGGLYRLMLSQEVLATPLTIDALSMFYKKTSGDEKVWFTNIESIADWIRKRESLQLLFTHSGDTLQVSVVNRSNELIENARIAIMAPLGVGSEQVKIITVNKNCTFDADAKSMYLNLPSLKPKEIFIAEFVPTNPRPFNASLRSLPLILIIGGVLLAVFLGVFIYYFFFNRRARFIAASEQVSIEDQLLDYGIYGEPEPTRTSADVFNAQVQKESNGHTDSKSSNIEHKPKWKIQTTVKPNSSRKSRPDEWN